MQRIIVINGVAGAGKDTFVQLFTKYSYVHVFEWSTIETVKAIAEAAFGWDGEKDEAGRRLLSDLKDAWTRYNDGSFREIREYVRYYDRLYEDFVFFIHVREPEEIQKIVDAWPDRVTTILIDRPSLPLPYNNADRNVRKFNYNIHIDNSTSLESLEVDAKTLARIFTALNVYPQ